VVQVVLVGAIAWGVYRAVAPELRELSWEHIAQLEPDAARLVLSTILLVVVYLAHALLWRTIMMNLRVATPGVLQTIRVYFLSSLGRYLPGKLWQLAGVAVLANRAGWSAGGAAAAAVLGQIAFLTTGLVFLAFLLPRWAGGAPALAGAGVMLAAVGGAWLVLVTRQGHGARTWLLARVPERATARLRSAFDLAGGLRPSVALSWAIGYALTWVLLGLAFTLFVAAFVPGAFTSARALAGTVASSYLVGYLILIAPAGLGARELAMSGLLAQIPDFPAAAVLVVPVASRLWFTLAEVLPLALVPLARARQSDGGGTRNATTAGEAITQGGGGK
jgi:hypothetical protein